MKTFLHPKKYGETPIVLTHNPKTGYNWGEDGENPTHNNPGYRRMSVMRGHNSEPMVIPQKIELCSVFDGVSMYGEGHGSPVLVLDGGLKKASLYMRELPARALEEAAKIISIATHGELHFILVDGLETYRRQCAGFTMTLNQILETEGIVNPTLTQLHHFGKKADGTYTYVQVERNSHQYKELKAELLNDVEASKEINYIADTLGREMNLAPRNAKGKALFELISISTNCQRGPAKGRDIPLNYEHNAHAGGGAADIFTVDKKGRLISLIPYLWVGREAAMDYSEHDENFDNFKMKWSVDSRLQQHMKKIGYNSPSDFGWTDWEYFRMANRVRYHTFVTALGCTFYSAHNPEDGGENWHFEPDGVVLFSWDGKEIARNTYIKNNKRAGRGNPGHTLQMSGPKAIAIYGGVSGHEQARRQGILV